MVAAIARNNCDDDGHDDGNDERVPSMVRRMLSDDNGSTFGTKDGRHVVNVDGDFCRTITVILFPATIMLCA